MYSNPQKVTSKEVVELRCEGGQWLKQLRNARGLSQRQLADKVGIEYYTFISQLECGRGRIPPDRYRIWADALGVESRHFVRLLMHFYDPVTYHILFEGDQIPIGRKAAPWQENRSTTPPASSQPSASLFDTAWAP
jgi:transcriptional regulator with XRE-family HTH domain